jgi:hypothetical protein
MNNKLLTLLLLSITLAGNLAGMNSKLQNKSLYIDNHSDLKKLMMDPKTIETLEVYCVDLANIDLRQLSNLKKLTIYRCTSANSILRKNSEYYDDSKNKEIAKTTFELNGQKELGDNIQGFESNQQKQSRKDFLERLVFLLKANN